MKTDTTAAILVGFLIQAAPLVSPIQGAAQVAEGGALGDETQIRRVTLDEALGLIGSKTKRARFRTKLQALGHSPAQISRINCPIGDPALGKEPKAIALGVAAELIRSTAQSSARKEAAE